MPEPKQDGLCVLVADDEAPARRRIVDLLRADPSIGRIVEASDGRQTVTSILAHKPDLLFLDIQMPELTGLEVISELGPDGMPLTVFVTAYDQHALRAFEANALDYLLKPFSDERMEATLARARTRLADQRLRTLGHDVLRVLASPTPVAVRRDLLAVKSTGSTRFIRIADIDWIEGAGAYVALHLGGKEVLHRSSLTELEALLDPSCFVRIHRSAILNLDRLTCLEPTSHGEFDAILKDGTRTRVSRTYRAALEQRLGQQL
jgi:two-component system LytT family response regulator